MSVFIRMAETNDCKDVFNWRNDEHTRKMSFNSALLNYEEHESWFYKILNDPKEIMFIGFDENNEKIGVVRFDNINEGIFIINVNVAPQKRGRGLGGLLIKESCTKLQEMKIVKEIQAKIKEENIPSIRAFSKAGFIKVEKRNNVIEMRLQN